MGFKKNGGNRVAQEGEGTDVLNSSVAKLDMKCLAQMLLATPHSLAHAHPRVFGILCSQSSQTLSD